MQNSVVCDGCKHAPESGVQLVIVDIVPIDTVLQARPRIADTPQNKENEPRSEWSPIRRQKMNLEDEVLQCTKRFSVYRK